jgi:hypothetical protein
VRPAQPPPLDPRLAQATRRLFHFLSRERRHRIFHPVGRAYRCEVVVDTATPLAPVGRHPGLLRLSRGVGFPRPLPDVLGLALRIEDAHGPGLHQHILLASTSPRRRAAYLPVPVTSFFRPLFSSLLPFRLNGELALVLARSTPPRAPERKLEPLAEVEESAATASVRFELAVGPVGRSWRRFGTVELRERLSAEAASRLRFNPYNTGAQAEPVWLPNRLRDPAYRGSQEGRPIAD